ncbi:MAG: response regulator [Rhodoferax sp.]|uniref:response regulator n=1 Tax=Rhodoferax sp. TaxID=50421 RepID=UPI001B4E210E|nr:response regulator [Rhodoferax sp.]MBP9904987.1 response regulator [Rhodoferax sp.]
MTLVKPKVLVVEDELLVARDIEQQLLDLGYQPVGLATRGEEAIALAKQWRPDLVLMDIQLAGDMDGITAAQVIRDQCALPVVFLTAYTADDVLARAKLTEPFGYMLKPFSERELRTVLAMALYKHQAEARLLNSTRQLKALSRRVLEAQEQERRRVAVELHDELGQSLTAIKINLQLSERFKDKSPADLNLENIRIVEDALQQVRRLATTLRPSMLDDLGLSPALKWMSDQAAQRGGFTVHFFHERVQARLAPEIETACFRIVQEALTNITRHAQARRVSIQLGREGDEMVLLVQDDGLGFDLPAMHERAVAGGSLGVLGMQERATLIGGQLDIESVPGQGTTLTLRCPWRGHEDPA